MNIFCDYHHGSLYESFVILFEKRLKHNLYRPYGSSWKSDIIWSHPEAIHNDNVYDFYTGDEKRRISFEQFKNIKIDILIATVPENIGKFKKIIKEIQPSAKLIFVPVNNFSLDWKQVDNAMMACSAKPDIKNRMVYHQEFDVINKFNYTPYQFKQRNKISTFLKNSKHEELISLEKRMPDYEFKLYGYGRDIKQLGNLWDEMKDSMFVFHLKSIGDGYGHIIHNIFATGRVCVTRQSYYKNMMAEALLEDEVTYLNIDGLNEDQIIQKIRKWSNPEMYNQLSVNAYNRFKSLVDFDREEKEIEDFLTRLI